MAEERLDEMAEQVLQYTAFTDDGLNEDGENSLPANYEVISALPEDNISSSSSSSSAPLEDSNGARDSAPWKTAVENNIGDLLRFASLIRQQSTSRALQGGGTYDPLSADVSDSSDEGSDGTAISAMRKKNHVSQSAQFQAHAEYVLRREIGLERSKRPEVKLLQDRLLKTMMTRWRRICYRSARGQRLAKMAKAKAKEDEPQLTQTLGLQSQVYFFPGTRYEKLDTTVPQVSPETGHMPRSSVGGATTLASEFSFHGQGHFKSNTQKSSSRDGRDDLSLPTMPTVEYVGDDYLYNCPYCGILPMMKKPFDRHTWK